ncbi:MAG TPA: hypothetical protein VGI46_10600 [Candidatus Acidoferrum sp.]
MDFALVEVVDMDVVVVIRFVAMEIIPKERVAQVNPLEKRRFIKIAIAFGAPAMPELRN